MVEVINGSKFWHVDGNLHRVDGPAIENSNGTKAWHVLHRVDGPSIEFADGTKEWWFDGKRYSYEEWLEVIPNKISYLWRCYHGNG